MQIPSANSILIKLFKNISHWLFIIIYKHLSVYHESESKKYFCLISFWFLLKCLN